MRARTPFPQIVEAALSAVLCSLAIPNELLLYGSPALGFVALIPLYRALSSSDTYAHAALSGAVFGALHHGLSSFWLFFYKDYAFWTLGSTTLAYAVIYGVAGTYAKFILSKEARAYRPFLFALGWTLLEYFKSIGFLGYPWGLIPYSQTVFLPLLQIVDITGVYGLSFILALISALLSERSLDAGPFEKPQAASELLFALLLTISIAGYGVAALNREIPLTMTTSAILVQQNTDPWIAGENAALESNVRLARNALTKSRENGNPDPDLIIFSETSLRRPFAEYKSWFSTHPREDPLLSLVADSGAHLLTGAPVVLDWDSYAASNSTILVSPKGELLGTYAKMHPVPFAEAIPLWEYAWFRAFMREVVGLESGWVMGTEPVVFSLDRGSGKLLFSTPICFEDAFADLCRTYVREGAEVFINLTNDSWSRTKSAQVQHWAIARLRAIENRRTLVRSTNSGVTGIVDPWGRSIMELSQFEALAQRVEIPVYKADALTVYTIWGDWFPLFVLLLFVSRIIILVRKGVA